MWISGYQLRRNVYPPGEIAVKIQYLQNISCPFKISVHSETCYLMIDNVEVSFRNHLGKGYDIGIYLAAYRTWEESKHNFLNIPPQLQSTVNINRTITN